MTTADLDRWLILAGAANLPSGNPYRLGDATLDGVVDGSDFSIWNGLKVSSGNGWCGGDFNADGATDGSDFSLWNANKFTSSDFGGRDTTALPSAFLARDRVFAGRPSVSSLPELPDRLPEGAETRRSADALPIVPVAYSDTPVAKKSRTQKDRFGWGSKVT